ncbi:MAG: ABC transporter ATP-binding protein YtrE [Spirochaetes bacterium ADurb.Bin269]|jgi:putative ABC transport system ATP-binding protein|nr:MAG: ABC transporter ATP-binding protein YtrE [Spirochaetes bacterium ADurb.Bin269]
MPFIKTSQLTKEYQLGKTTVHALRGVDIEVEKGEYLCVSGPSGAGKSTFLNLIGLLDRPTSGSIHFDDTEVHTLDRKKFHRFRRGRIAFIFQSFNLVPVLDARENIEFPLLIQKIDAAERNRRIDAITEEVGIRGFLDHKPDELSGGQRQRVAIARALVTRPEVIIADEPTANLDSVTGRTIMELLKRLNREERTTFIIASHDTTLIREADRMIRIVDGLVSA